MKKSTMMKAAHEIAKHLVIRTGNYQIALSFALKYVWTKAKAGKKRMGDMAIMFAVDKLTRSEEERNSLTKVDGLGYIPMWIAKKNLDAFDITLIQTSMTTAEVVKETEKAVDVCFHTDRHVDVYMWVPKSVIK